MLNRNAVLAVGLICALPALCAEEPEMRITAESVVASQSELLCSRCVVSLAPNTEMKIEANYVEADKAGLMKLEGAVRITFRNGGELRSESVTVKSTENGEKELSGDEFRLIKAALR